MSSLQSVSRRDFLQLGAISSLGLVIGIPGSATSEPSAGPVVLHPLIRIGRDGEITIFAQNPEMGQGVKTALPMLIAEELEVAWEQITVQQADLDRTLGQQFSGGSLSIRLNYDAMRKAGAAAREMLVNAAAERWQRPAGELRATNGQVTDPATGRTLGYGELADAAARQPVPDDPALKPESDFSLIGQPVADVDLHDIVTGRQTYSLDLKLPGMLYAVVVRSPVSDGQPASFDARAATAVPGVIDVFPIRNDRFGGRVILPNCPNFVSGVAVLAETTGAAMAGARKLDVNWQLPDQRDDTVTLMRRFEAAIERDGEVVRDDGDIDTARQTAGARVDVTYRLPFLAHMPMEPMNCTADVRDNGVDLWAPTQNPALAADAVAKALGIDPAGINVHVMRSGGAFGRRFYADFVVDAAVLSRHSGRPVKVVWTREDDVRHDYFRPASIQHVRAGIDTDGRLAYWHHKVVSHPRETFLERDGSPAEIANYEFPAAFVPNLRYEYTPVAARIPVGQWRAVEHSSNVFVVSSVIDELAHAAGQDPLAFWLSLVGTGQFVQVRENFAFDASRLRRVIDAAAESADWGRPLPRGRGRGIAASYNQGSWVAEVAEVTVKNGALSVDRVVVAIDCGRVINPSGAKQQVYGGILEGTSAALFGEITVRDGVVEQSNFHDYRWCRMQEAPDVEIRFVGDSGTPRGLGEPPLPPVAPAICNAIYAATGERIRELPLKKHFAV